MRSLQQPGPIHQQRIDTSRGDCRTLPYALPQGQTLTEALTAPLVASGFQSAAITFANLAVNPFRYVTPAPSATEDHVAWYSAPHSPAGTTRIERANASFGWADGKPFIHCHATWIEPDGQRRGGHILPHETIIAAQGEAKAWAFPTIRLETRPDPETNFTLLQPSGSETGPTLFARIKPNEDLITALETIARTHDLPNATIRGSLGSLIGASFTHGGTVTDHATEVLVRQGHIRNFQAELNLLVVDMQGQVHEGWLRRGENPVCITFDIVLQPTETL